MSRLYRRWETPSLFGDVVVMGFVIAQCLDGAFTYLGITLWGPAAEGNPLIRSVVSYVGLEAGLYAAKLFATALGIVLHLCRVHNIVALLTVIYIGCSIVPWTIFLFL